MGSNTLSGSLERTDVGLVIYGSLLEPSEWNETPREAYRRGIPVKVHGYKRVFNNEADYRSYKDKRRAVLNVEESSGAWFNGILIPWLYEDEKEPLLGRESGYSIERIASSAIEPYDSTNRVNSATSIETVVGDKKRKDILPIPSYIKICLKGARYWGADFYEDFVRVTEVVTGETLEEYLRNWNDGK